MTTIPDNRAPAAFRRDEPIPSTIEQWWGSDAIAALLRQFDIPYACLNPGSSFRGLHDSLVNYNGNQNPQIVLCLHEEHAVSIAHGYTKVTGKPLAVILHSNVGLMHASMAIYNAWCDRVPMLILGAHGPVDAAKRRPWIDWIHTSQDAGAMVRSFVKWDDQPVSLQASMTSLRRARQITETAPKAPVYVCLDVTMQETRLDGAPVLPNIERYAPTAAPYANPELVKKMAQLLAGAQRPVLLVGRVSRDESEWQQRIELAERLQAQVFTDLKVGAAFPTSHPLHPHAPSVFLSADATATLKQADVILSLDWVDLQGALKQAWGGEEVSAKVLQVSLDHTLHNAASLDHQDLPPCDLYAAAEPASVVRTLLAELGQVKAATASPAGRAARPRAADDGADDIHMPLLADTLSDCLEGSPACLIRLPLGWSGDLWHFEHPLDYLGYDGGAGIGSGPGMAVGASIALKDSDRLPVAIIGDGDFLMGNTALWSAAALQVPMLVIVANNQSFFNDEVHQERVALDRERPVENRWIGQRIGNPRVDLAGMARSQGFEGIGPIFTRKELAPALADAIVKVRAGKSVLIDVQVRPGYAPSMSTGMTKSVE
ncbi:thiamine pyrophosphate-binding protein [Massilia sp. Mn16-1_5]|uniref:thiamine pyrophosphate-binding protein n=1 Tax=Massilia sp. Mn16-1_5 TaxID=2079199 RepID=UPI00109E3E3B|nr:thiamine pyrophosphate-binding protein [Massilia sp. Mn16-1_5]THC39296.1 acetolactate synthase [Massilia sp. Mn16-1_5]